MFSRSDLDELVAMDLFLAPDFLRVHKLPIKVPEEVIVGRHFYIKPLLPLLDDAGPFWLLTISASGARFFQGSRWNFGEVPGVDLAARRRRGQG